MQNQITHIHLETITSTNTWAKENYLRLDPNHITCITASEQTGGRGQLNRAWISPKDLNLYLTYFFTLEKMAPIQNLAQLLSLSAAKCLESYHLTPQIKWPNDLLIQNKKIAGVLCEIIDLNHMNGIILGIGINVNMPKELLKCIDQPSTSLLVTTGKRYNLTTFLADLNQIFQNDLTLFKKEGFVPFFNYYNKLLVKTTKTILIKQGNQLFKGTFHSLNADGSLNLLLDSGEIKSIYSGEIKNLEAKGQV